jgi:acetylornithine deacetylase/succinyl-diaminopimelate desuccinylase-like protein
MDKVSKKALKWLVETDTVSPNDFPAIDKFLDYLLSNFENLEIQKGAGYLWLKIKGLDSSRCTILNGHIDTVPAGDIELWDTDPFKLVASADKSKYYGLGVTDMKAGLAVMCYVLNFTVAVKPKNDIYITVVAREEIDGQGSKNLTQNKLFKDTISSYQEKECIILEPTNSTWWGDSHRGNIFTTVNIHSGNIEIALNKYVDFYKKIRALEQEVGENADNAKLKPTLSITNIDYRNNILEILLDCRTTAFDHVQILKFIKSLPSYELVEDLAPGVHFDSRISRHLTNVNIAKKEFVGATDMPYFNAMDVPTVIYGPGSVEKMHLANEYLEVAQYDECLTNIIEYIC